MGSYFSEVVLHCSFMENIFLVKIQKCKSNEKLYTITFCQKFLTQLKSRNLTIKIDHFRDATNLCFKNLSGENVFLLSCK